MTRLWQSSPFALALLMALSFVVYGSAINHDFVFDDETQIVGNPSIQSLSNIPNLFLTSTNQQNGSSRLDGIYYKPIMTTVYALLWSIAGLNSAVFHGFQVALTGFNAWLTFLFLLQLLISFGLVARRKTALAVAALFLLHPLNCEIAVYSADLQDGLYFAFGLGALLLAMSPKPCTCWRATGLATLLLLSVLSKESGVIFGLATIAWWVLFRRKNIWIGVAACAGAATVYLLLRVMGAGLTAVIGNSWAHIGHASLGERLLSLPQIVWHYVSLFAWPERLLSAQDWMVRALSLGEFWLPLTKDIAVLIVSFCAARALRLGRHGHFLGVIFGAGLGLHLQFVPLDGTVADRWFYVPMLAVAGFFALAVSSMFTRWPQRAPQAALGIAAVLGGVWSVRSWVRTQDWRDNDSLFGHDLALDPDNALFNNNFGVQEFRHGKIRSATSHFEHAVQLSPYWMIPWNNLGASYEALDRLDDAEKAYHMSIAHGAYFLAYENYPRLLLRRGKVAQAKVFIETLGLRTLPNNKTLLALQAAIAQHERAPAGP